jgi:DNA polymerase III subunit epsilon
MPKCSNCGKSDIYLELNKYGLCNDCRLELKEAIKDIKIEISFVENTNKNNYIRPIKINDSEKIKIDDSEFVAIDFETANTDRSSACSLGITIVENNKIVDNKYWLIRPHELYFDPFNISIHGITENDVKDKPEFCELWPEIKGYLDNNLIIAHNASFDISVLRHVLNQYNINYPEFYYTCTWYISRKVWQGLNSYCLDNVANHLSIKFQHHNALEDAKACSLIAIEACNEKNVYTINKLAEVLKLKHGYIRANEYNPVHDKEYSYSTAIKIKDIKPENDNFDENCPVYNKSFVFTGTLESMPRNQAIQKVINTGGICHQTVRKDTDYLVIGIQDYKKLKDGKRSSKMLEAEDLIKKSFKIEIIKEDDFLNMFI